MSFEKRRAMALDYQPVSYPGSALRFRGPATDFAQPHVLCIGSTETFGRFIPTPYPEQLAARLGRPVCNMGVAHAGLDVALGDPAILAAAETASAIVLQVPGAANMSNRYYCVHPRRNDRFVRADAVLQTVYRDVDFTEFHFTRHLLSHLKALSPDRFAILRHELQLAWRGRMMRFLTEARVPVHLLWLSRRQPETPEPETGLGPEPLFVTRDLLMDVAASAASLSIVTDPAPAPKSRLRGMFFSAREENAARMLPGPGAHATACATLLDRMEAS
jgi:hypothetical protein